MIAEITTAFDVIYFVILILLVRGIELFGLVALGSFSIYLGLRLWKKGKRK